MTTSPSTSHKKSYDATALVLLAVLFVALVILTTFAFRGWRVDLTQSRLYSIAPGTQHILGNLQEPIHLYFFFSDQPSAAVPAIRSYGQRVRELLEEMAQRSKGQIKLTVIDPEPFTEQEDRASEFGLNAAPVGAHNDNLYFGLAGTNSTDGREVIPFFAPDKEEFLEYDVASLIYRLAHPKKTTVGLISSLPVNAAFDPQTGQASPGWASISQVHDLFDLKALKPDLTTIDKDIGVLLLLHPKNLTAQALYAIDQFVMRGGKILAFVDPESEQENPESQMAMPGVSRASDLGPLLTSWGIDFDRSKVLVDSKLALSVAMRAGEAPSKHLAILAIGHDNLDRKDVVSSGLETINVMTTGVLSPHKGSTTQFTPLIQSSTDSALYPVQRMAMLSDPQSLRDGFKASGQSYTIAARVHGKVNSAFPNGAPAAAAPGANPATTEPALKASQGDANIIVVADSDVLADMLWVRTQNVLGQRVAVAWANNGDFLSNALDNLTGSSDLISVRGRQSFFRPFERVDALRGDAEAHLRTKEQELDQQLKETESKLTELQSGRSDQKAMVLTPEQESELTRFQQERTRIRKELREVRRGLQVDIDRLGTALKILNIAAIPILLTIGALVLLVVRRNRLRRRYDLASDRGSAA
jgi:ABC-type uncharacterized transport system involved in gliding motility auxiliary subunit